MFEKYTGDLRTESPGLGAKRVGNVSFVPNPIEEYNDILNESPVKEPQSPAKDYQPDEASLYLALSDQ